MEGELIPPGLMSKLLNIVQDDCLGLLFAHHIPPSDLFQGHVQKQAILKR